MNKIFPIFMVTMLLFSNNVLGLSSTTSKNNFDDANEILDIDKKEPKVYHHREIVDENGNVPAYQYYEDVESRGINVLKHYKGKIFLGLGDYDRNTGPTKIIYYNVENGKIESSGTISDEEVFHFNIYDDKLYTSGSDVIGNWGTGYYYVYNEDENKWDSFRFDNGWIHVFNIEKYKDKFVMVGSVTTDSNRSPVQVSNDGGKTFDDLKLYKYDDEVPTSGSIRVTNCGSYGDSFIVYVSYIISDSTPTAEKEMLEQGKYYGFYLYDHETNKLNFMGTIPYKESSNGVSRLQYNNLYYMRNIKFNDKFLVISGEYLLNLYQDQNDSFRAKRYSYDSEGYIVQNMVNFDDELYLLLYKKNGTESFDVRISKTKDLESFEVIYDFETKSAPSAIEVYGDKIYVGTINSSATIDENNVGALYEISAKPYLNLNKEDKQIDVAIDSMEYPVDYKLGEDSWSFTAELKFNDNMTKEEYEKEFSKVEKMYLMYALVNEEKVDLDEAYRYYKEILENNELTLEEEYNSAIDFANNYFSEDINIETEKMKVASKLVSDDDGGYKVLFTISSPSAKVEAETPDTYDGIVGIAFTGVISLVALLSIIYLKKQKEIRVD